MVEARPAGGAEMADDQLQQHVLTQLNEGGEIADSADLCSSLSLAPAKIDAALKSLLVDEFVVLEVIERRKIELTEEGQQYARDGTPEFQYASALAVGEETLKTDVEGQVGAQIAKIGFAKAMKNKWVKIAGDKKEKVVRIAEELKDEDKLQLSTFLSEPSVDGHDKKMVDQFKKRKLISVISQKSYKVTKGANYQPVRAKLETQLTAEMLRTGEWKTAQFKKTNINAVGQVPQGGHLHPLLKVRSQFREILLSMGFNEMPTNRWVESSFWNFDTLFQPQSHPARDLQDTFFCKDPVMCNRVPEEYKRRVKSTHEDGLPGSIGYGPGWSGEETMKNILRTHTTAISSQMLYQMAQQSEFKPMKFFSIDRVFRNETLDATHLAEFHQVEGVVVDKGIGLHNLLGVMKTFFAKIGIKNLKYKPAYNPYTEPSLEIFGYHPQLKKWIEIGNSGVFRPEMLEPMGLPKDVSVIAWGLSLERPTMIYYNVDNIRDLFGHKVSISTTKKNPICYIQNETSSVAPRDDTRDVAVPKERTFIMIKPDGVQRGQIGQIMQRFEKKGFKLAGMKLCSPGRAHLEAHYADLKKKPFFPGLIDYMCSGPVCAMVWEGDNAVVTGRKMLGATKPADSNPGTMRGDLCIHVGRNIIHGSDSVDSANNEISLWFKPSELISFKHHSNDWVYE